MFYRNKLILAATLVSAILVPWVVWGDGASTLTKAVSATQSGTWNIGTLTTLTTVTNPVAVTESGTWSVRAQDGSGNNLTSATRGAQQALSVQVVDGSGTQITSFGSSGGTSSSFGSAVPATGTAAGFTDGTNMQMAKVDASKSVQIMPRDSGGTDMTDTTNHALKINMAACSGCSTDGSAFTLGTSATSSMGAVNSTGLKAVVSCNNVAIINTSSSGTAQLVALASSKAILVCGWKISTSSASATNVSLTYGTGSNCGTGTTTMSDTIRFPAGVTGLQGHVALSPFYNGLTTATSNALCVTNSAAVQIDGLVYYTQI